MNLYLIQLTIEHIGKEYQLTNLEPVSSYFGIEVERDSVYWNSEWKGMQTYRESHICDGQCLLTRIVLEIFHEWIYFLVWRWNIELCK